MKIETPAPPAPKYKLGESIAFDRDKTDSGKTGEGMLIDMITAIEITVQDVAMPGRPAGSWHVRYYMARVDDDVPEDCILGPATVGPKR